MVLVPILNCLTPPGQERGPHALSQGLSGFGKFFELEATQKNCKCSLRSALRDAPYHSGSRGDPQQFSLLRQNPICVPNCWGKHTFATTRLISMLAKCLLGRRLPRDLLAKDQIFAGEEGCFLALTGFCGVSRTASSSLSTVTSQGAGVLELDAGRSSRLSLTSSWLSRSISTEFVLDSLSCTFDVWPATLPAER